jgi:hypothetical protein
MIIIKVDYQAFCRSQHCSTQVLSLLPFNQLLLPAEVALSVVMLAQLVPGPSPDLGWQASAALSRCHHSLCWLDNTAGPSLWVSSGT